MVFPWQRRSSGDATTGASPQPKRGPSPQRARKSSASAPQTKSPARRSSEDASAQSAAFTSAAGSAQTVDAKTLRSLLLKQPIAQQLSLDEELMSSFLHSCSISADKDKGSPSSVLARASPTRFSYTQYLRALDDLRSYHDNISQGICIVGNGRSVLTSGAGGLVDTFGTVVRFNEYQTDDFSKHVGKKTDLWVLSDWTCIKLINKYPKRLEPVLICVPFKFMGKPYYHERRAEVEAELTAEQLRRVTFVPADIARNLIEQYEFGDRWPSSGLITIWYFLHECPDQQLMLHGFDFFKEIDGKIHYMEDNCKANHHASQEERCCMDLRKAGRVAFVA